MPIDNRFDTDQIPDSTWGICRLHSPVGIVRLVGDDGLPTENGVCEMCHAEMNDAENFTSCPVHGTQPKTQGAEPCCEYGRMGTLPGPSQAEIDREAEQIGRIWAGGPPVVKDGLAPPPAGSADERDL